MKKKNNNNTKQQHLQLDEEDLAARSADDSLRFAIGFYLIRHFHRA